MIVRARRLVQVARRLVGQQDVGPRREGAGKRHALLLAARQLRRVVLGPVAPAPSPQARPRRGRRHRGGPPVPAASPRSRAPSSSGSGGRTGRPRPYDRGENGPARPRQARSDRAQAQSPRPPVARSSPPMSMRRDDLPDPDGPTSPTVSPRATSQRDAACRISTGPALPSSVSSARLERQDRIVSHGRAPSPVSHSVAYGARARRMPLRLRAGSAALAHCRPRPSTVIVAALGDCLTQGYGLPQRATGSCPSSKAGCARRAPM